MRTIKFRAQNFGGYWRYSDKCKNGLGEFFNYFRPDDGSSPILNQNTLGQFTGLLDKNGKEIYEGDILSHIMSPTHYLEIKYQAPKFLFYGRDGVWNTELKFPQDYEIRGNLYENPDLIK